MIDQLPQFTRHLEIVAVSGNTVIVQPKSAEAADFPAAMYSEAQKLASEADIPVVFLDKHGHRAIINP
jgi:hypothetical protein